jgi:hypothetical protein
MADAATRDAIESCGGEATLRGFEEDVVAGWGYLNEHHDELTDRYPDEWIALHRDQVVAHAFDPRDLGRLLDEQGIDRRSLVMHQMTTKQRTLLL